MGFDNLDPYEEIAKNRAVVNDSFQRAKSAELPFRYATIGGTAGLIIGQLISRNWLPGLMPYVEDLTTPVFIASAVSTLAGIGASKLVHSCVTFDRYIQKEVDRILGKPDSK